MWNGGGGSELSGELINQQTKEWRGVGSGGGDLSSARNLQSTNENIGDGWWSGGGVDMQTTRHSKGTEYGNWILTPVPQGTQPRRPESPTISPVLKS